MQRKLFFHLIFFPLFKHQLKLPLTRLHTHTHTQPHFRENNLSDSPSSFFFFLFNLNEASDFFFFTNFPMTQNFHHWSWKENFQLQSFSTEPNSFASFFHTIFWKLYPSFIHYNPFDWNLLNPFGIIDYSLWAFLRNFSFSLKFSLSI